ncbi:MAG: GDSL-type esterase/lipase family protein [Polyangiales bacterium]
MFRRIVTSPLGVLALSVTALTLWTVAYRAQAETGTRSPLAEAALLPGRAEAQSEGAGLGVRPRVPTLPAIPEVRPPPRLRAPWADGSPPGLEIAVQDRDGHSLDALHAALRRAHAGQGQARLVFYGASHTASDLYTGYLRAALQQMFGDAGHGFVLPVTPWRGYRHQGVEVASAPQDWVALKIGAAPWTLDHYGFGGVAVEASTPSARGSVETTTQFPFGQSVGLFDLYYLIQPDGGRFDVLIDGLPVERVSTAGDLRQPGYATFHVPDGPHRLEVRVVGDGPVRLFGVVMEREVPGIVVDQLGINGARARSHLFWDDALYREHLRRRNPDLVVLAYGTNESGDDQPIEEYRDQLRQVVGRIRETVPNASCLLVGPSDRPLQVGRNEYVERPRTAQIVETQWRVALENGCAFFDTVAFQGGPMSTVAWAEMSPPYAGRDMVHFTRRGYERMGQVILGALLDGTSYRPPANVVLPGSEPIPPIP